ncbi:MAG: translation elongation factor Ts [Candidatus Aminicenantes bacterium]|nr:translation elongation factor Ts [Candidatus Aminicenantes bacterium]
MEITAAVVKELRERTGIGMMECKKALTECDGEIEEAIKLLRKKGYARAEKRSGRQTSEGLIGSYIHMNGKLGVIVELNCETDFVAKNKEFGELLKNISMHIAAANPQYVSSDDIPEKILEEEKEIIGEQFKDSKKPPEIIEKITTGKLGKFYSEVCLLEQAYIKDDKITIKELISSFIAKTGENVKVARFTRYAIG